MFPKTLQQRYLSYEIRLLIVFVMMEPFLTQSLVPSLKETSLDQLPMNNVLFTDNVLLEVSARSKIECSLKCAETQGCFMCTFHASSEGPQGNCRIYNKVHTLTDSRQNSAGAKTLAPRGSCGDGYSMSCGRCMRAVTQTLTYADAENQCSLLDQGQLVMPKTTEDLVCLQLFLQSINVLYSWVGLDDKEQPTVFKWKDGTVLPDSSLLWRKQSSEPENVNPGADCARARSELPNLYDGPCSEKYAFVCQTSFA